MSATTQIETGKTVQQRRLLSVEVLRSENPTTGATGGPCLDFVASTGCVDRYQEIIEPAGWQLANYLRNPVFQNAHKYGDVIHTLGRAVITEIREIGEGQRGLFQRIEFATEVNPIARIAYGLYAKGFLRAVSVGFLPLRWEDGSEKTEFRRRYIEQELLEVSAVAVPANPEALALAEKSGAITRDDLRESAEVLSIAANGAAASGRTDLVHAALRLREAMRSVR